MSSLPIGVVGAGPGGLTTAAALARAGREVRVFERAPAIQVAGAGLTVHVNAMRMLDALGLADAVAAAGVPLVEGRVSTSAGRRLSSFAFERAAAPFGQPILGIHRARLSEVLAAALPSGALQLDAALAEVRADDEHVDVTLASGEVVRVAALIGADGLHSRVRERVFGPWPTRYSGYTCWRGVAPIPCPLGAGVTEERWGPGRRFGLVPIARDATYWFATANVAAGGDDADRHAAVTERFAHFGGAIAETLAATPAEAVLRHDIADLTPRTEWTRGLVALLGDAAHATTPNLGQGACLAIEDGVTLAHALTQGLPDAEALQSWASARVERSHYVVNLSQRVGAVGQWESRPARALRDALVAAAPAWVSERQVTRLWAVEPPSFG